MYKMVIVDDEYISRQGIKNLLNWTSIDIEIVGEADEGLSAISLIHEKNPDIVICDIKMPKMDGISMINKVRPSHPNLQVIFISGYSDIDYLKNAIKLDAVDYIFKPFQLDEFLSAIKRAKKKLTIKKESSVALDADIALKILHADFVPNRDIPLNLYSSMITIVININKEYITKYNNSNLIANHFFNSFYKTAEAIFHGQMIMSCANSGYIIHGNVDENIYYGRRSNLKLYDFFFILDDKNAISVGVSDLVLSSHFLDKSYWQASEAVKSSFLTGNGKIVFYHDLSSVPFVPRNNLNVQFYNNLIKNNITEAINYLDDYISYMCRCRTNDIPVIKDILASISFWLDERLPNNKENRYITEIVYNSSDIHLFHQYLLKQIDRYVNEISNLNNKGKIILEVEKYIRDNYDKDLSLKTISKQVFVTPNYLCYLYKKKTGKTLNQFILDVKMENARRLICDSKYKINDIAEILGYNNQNYFTKVFTNYYGDSPRAYRNKQFIIKD